MNNQLTRLSVLATLALLACVHGCRTSERIANITKRSAKRLVTNQLQTGTNVSTTGSGWNWTNALPQDVSRAEIVPTSVPSEVVAVLVPSSDNEIRLASHRPTSPTSVSRVDGRQIANCAQLQSIVERVLESGDSSEVVLEQGNTPLTTVSLTAEQLAVLSNRVGESSAALRIDDEEGTWLLIRDQGIRCRVLLKVDRKRGLIQMVMSLGIYYGSQQLLPKEVKLEADGTRMRCLTASETLARLYEEDSRPDADNASSFALVSESDNYLAPTNYRELEELHRGSKEYESQQPALLQLRDKPYPGSALLGDARALSTLMLRQELYSPGESERVGWIMFGSNAAREATSFNLTLDLGSGPKRFTFRVI